MLLRRTHLRLAGLAAAAAAALVALTSAGPAHAAVSEDPVRTPSFNGSVYSVAFSGDVVYVGGSFTAAVVSGKQVPRQRLAAINARTGELLAWAPSADATVRAVTVAGDQVYVGGDFQTLNGQARDSLAQVHAATGALGPLKHRISGGTPRALDTGHGRLYMAGLFTGVDGVARSNVAAFSLADGSLSGWAPRTDDLVESLAVNADRVYLGGSFHRTNGISSTGRLISIRSDNAAVDLGFRPQPAAIVHAVTATSSGVYAAIGGQGGKAIAYGFDGKPKWTLTTDGDAQAITVLGSTVYIGGHFDNVCRSARTGDQGVCLDGSVSRIKFAAASLSGELLSWSPQGNGIRGVLSVAANPTLGMVAAGGEFTTVDGLSQKRFALFS